MEHLRGSEGTILLEVVLPTCYHLLLQQCQLHPLHCTLSVLQLPTKAARSYVSRRGGQQFQAAPSTLAVADHSSWGAGTLLGHDACVPLT